MKTLHFEGYSDDTFLCEGPQISVDYDNCANGKPVTMRAEAGGEAMLIRGHYAPAPFGGWLIGAGPVITDNGGDLPIPNWSIRIERSDRPYSPRLIVEAPDDVRVFLVNIKGRNAARDFIDL